MLKKSFVLLLTFLLTACHSQFVAKSQDWSGATKETINHYQAQTTRHFARGFRRAGVHFPPKQVSLLVFKQEKTLEVWARDDATWHYIQSYPMTASSGGPGPKLAEFDRQIPEGIYRIPFIDPFSHYHLSLAVNYPNAFDRRHAMLDGRHKLGHSIFIHGFNQSVGCIAIGDPAVEDVFTLVGMVGAHNTKLIIASNDLRKQPPLEPINHPKWIGELHHRLQRALSHYNR